MVAPVPNDALRNIKDIFSIVSSIATIGGVLAALYWFLFTCSFKRRIEFDCDLNIFDVGADEDYLAEVVLIVENKAQREHRLYNLWCEVRQPRILQGIDPLPTYLKLQNLVPEALTYFFIPAGVQQRFPKTFRIPRQAKVVRVIAMFTYEQERLDLSSLSHLTFDALDALQYDALCGQALRGEADEGRVTFGPELALHCWLDARAGRRAAESALLTKRPPGCRDTPPSAKPSAARLTRARRLGLSAPPRTTSPPN
jgi:hypothetical protein